MKKKIALFLAFGCIGANAASVNYDLLGRKGSKMNSPMVYRNVDYSKIKKNEQQKVGSSVENVSLKKVGLPNNIAGIEGRYAPTQPKPYYFKKIDANNNVSDGWYASVSGSNSYMEASNSVFIPVTYHTTTPANYEVGTLTHTDVSGYDVHMENFTYNSNNVHPSPYEYNKQIIYMPLDYARYRSYFIDFNWLYQAPYDGESSNVGVYMASEARPTKMVPGDDVRYIRYSPVSSFANMPGHEMIASEAYKILKGTSNRSVVYVGTDYPENPKDQSPQIYMGLHNRKCVWGNSSATNSYSAVAKKLDNYIYDNRTVEIAAAGNFATRDKASNPVGSGYLAKEAHAVNAITVGAVGPSLDYSSDYFTYNIANYTSYVTSETGNIKPEIYNFSHFIFNEQSKVYTTGSKRIEYMPLYDGTEISAAYTAGIVSDLLNANSFYRWHPEVVKAVLLTAGEAALNFPINEPYPHGAPVTMMPTYGSAVFNKMHNLCGHESRYWIGDMNKFYTHQRYGMKEIRFSVKRPKSIHHVAAAIAWLSSGNDVANLGKIPQDFDLYAYENDVADVNNINPDRWKDRSRSSHNSYELVSFDTDAEYITFRILFYNEEEESENKGQVVLGFDVSL